MASEKQEHVFDLVKSMTKAEKRNFRLYARRLDGNQDAKFITLFDQLEAADEYDEKRILARTDLTKEQLPNIKAHLYRQLLISMRLLNVQHSEMMQLREQLDFARILYDKGLYRQCERLLDKVADRAASMEAYPIALEVADFRTTIDTLNVSRDMIIVSDSGRRRTSEICASVDRVSELSNISIRAYSLYQQLGYARSRKDMDLILQYFKPKLEGYANKVSSFREKFYFYQACAWYYYIQHNFALSYRYSRLWVGLFEANPPMKELLYDDYLRGCAQILEALYLARRHKHFIERLDYFRQEFASIEKLNTNAYIIANRILYTNMLHRYFVAGKFTEGLVYVKEIEDFMARYERHMDVHYKMLVNYKIASLYFGAGNYPKCMEYLSRITGTKDPQVRRDLQCFARILHLIASYEAGIDYNLEYQIRSVYAFLVKMNDMHEVQREMLGFLKKLGSIYADDLKTQFRELHERLELLEDHPYERRAFYYLDIQSWLESKITGKSMGEILQEKFKALSR